MKKVLIGILILIPIFILLVVALVSDLIHLQAWIAVEDLFVTYKDSSREVAILQLYLDVQDGTVFRMSDWVDVSVSPNKANNYTVDWEINDLVCLDDDYQQQYEDYIRDPQGPPVHPAAVLVDGDGRDSDINTSGDFKVNAYCNFGVTVRAETITKHFFVNIVGDTVHSVALTDLDGGFSSTMTVGESKRLCASYVPMDSIITSLQFASSDESVLAVDQNGVITAVGEGATTIFVKADKYKSEDEYVISNVYSVQVQAGASVWGDRVVLPRSEDGKYAIEALGIGQKRIDEAACFGCSVLDGEIEIYQDKATVALADGGTLLVEICGPDDIDIVNSDFFGAESGYVLGVGDFGLKLDARYRATADDRVPNVVWTSDNEDVASVGEDGAVTGISAGMATITATSGGRSASVTLNVQQKTTSLRLMTSNEVLEAGLARQTVFAAERYVYETDAEGGDRASLTEPNSVLIRVQGEPENASAGELAQFYSRYVFEVAEGENCARFDANISNKLIFDPSAIESEGRAEITVKVSAKYPRFETSQRHTTDSVTLNAVFGVEVVNFEQMMRATKRQREYFDRADNFIPGEDIDVLAAPDGQEYRVHVGNRAARTYAITLGDNVSLAADQKLDYKMQDGVCVALFGDLYGNGYTLSAKPENVVNGSSHLVRVAASDVTVSNIQIRHQDMQIDTLDSSTFSKGYCVAVEDIDSLNYRVENFTLEYSILENSYGGIIVRNADVAVKGCIIRNISSSGINSFARVYDNYLVFPRIALHNDIFSSVISFNIGINHEQYSVNKNDTGRFSALKPQDPNKPTNDEIYQSREESFKWTEENLVPKRYVPCVDQTGFLDIYGWRDASKVNLIDTGEKMYNQMLAAIVGPLVESHPVFQPCVCAYNGIKYLHLGIMSAGINIPKMGERLFTQVNLEDDRFVKLTLTGLQTDVPGLPRDIKAILDLFIDFISLEMYNYRSDADLGPGSTYEINSKLIAHLHS